MNAPDIIWTATDAAAATGGQGVGNWRATGMSADIRHVRSGDLFAALPDAQDDGRSKAARALELGAAAVIAAQVPAGVDPARVLLVADPSAALEALARAAR